MKTLVPKYKHVELWASHFTCGPVSSQSELREEICGDNTVVEWEEEFLELPFDHFRMMTFSSVLRGSPCLPQQTQSRQSRPAFPMHQQCRLSSPGPKPINRQDRRHPGAFALVRAAAATAMPDIEERLSRFEWDRMNLADLTGMLQA